MSFESTWTQKIQSLPVLPQVAMRITERMQSPTATLGEISNLIKSDLGLTSKILKLANSSYYSIPGGVKDVEKALQYLGFNTVAQLVLTSSVFGAFKSQGSRDLPLRAFSTHSFATGLLSEISAFSLQYKNASEFFVSGLLHDLGKLILMELYPDQLSKTLKASKDLKITFWDAEIQQNVPTHVEMGVELARYWKLPKTILTAIGDHHRLLKMGVRELSEQSKESKVVAWANLWINTQKIGQSGNGGTFEDAAEAEFSEKIGISKSKKESIIDHFNKEFEKAGAILSGS